MSGQSNEWLLAALVLSQYRLTALTWQHDGSSASFVRCEEAESERDAARDRVLSRMSSPSHERAMAEGGWQSISSAPRGQEVVIWDEKWGVTLGVRFDGGSWGIATFNGLMIRANPKFWQRLPTPPTPTTEAEKS